MERSARLDIHSRRVPRRVARKESVGEVYEEEVRAAKGDQAV